MKLRVLLTNDDGIDAPGILALEKSFIKAGAEVVVVAPSEERSASSHSVSLRKPVKIIERDENHYAVSGTPVDAAHLAVNQIVRNRLPDMLISGINRGANLACDAHYSGTVGAAREGSMLGLHSMAVSLETFKEDPDFSVAGKFAVKVAKMVMKSGLPPRTILNVNVPDIPEDEIKGIRATVMGIRRYENSITRHENGGNPYYTLGGPPTSGERVPDSDILAVKEGWVSVTPLMCDMTHHYAMEWLRERLPEK